MTAIARNPRSERAIASAIVLSAISVALWIVLHRKPEVPLIAPRIEREEPAQAAPPESAPPQSSNPAALAFEIIELPPAPAPRPTQQIAAGPVPQPAPPRVEPGPQEQPSKPIAVAAPAKPVVPLRPEEPPAERPVDVAKIPPVTPLRPDERQAATIVPLRPEPERVREPPKPVVAAVTPLPTERPPVTPLVPEPEARRVRTPEKPMTPLAPEAERTSERPKVQKQEEPHEEPAPLFKPLPPVREVRVAAPAPLPRLEPPPPPPRAESRPQPSAPAAAPAPAPKLITGEAAGEGRVLLRMFEQGSGPGIEIRWPSEASDRERLYDTFVRCFGMRIGLVDDAGHLYLPEGPANQPTQLNMDRYSGFVRRPEGQIATNETREIARVRQYHQGTSGGSARIFPRNVDAFLIGGLRQAIGDEYLKTRSIRATYRLDGARVVVDAIVADGHPVPGAIDLSSGRSCR